MVELVTALIAKVLSAAASKKVATVSALNHVKAEGALLSETALCERLDGL
jgi:hypothetical protein